MSDMQSLKSSQRQSKQADEASASNYRFEQGSVTSQTNPVMGGDREGKEPLEGK